MTPPSPRLPDYQRHRIKKSVWLRPLRRGLQVWVGRGLLGLAVLLPVRGSQALGRAMGGLFHLLARKDVRLAREQLAMAMPELSPGQVRRTIRRCFGHFGQTAWESLALPRIRRQGERWITLENLDVLRRAHEGGRGVILLTGHMANWELYSVAAQMARIPMRAVVRVLADPRLDAMMARNRQSDYLTLLKRGSPDASKQLLQTLKKGEVLLLAIDQDNESQGVFVEFFGRAAHTPRVAASLALKLGLPVVTGFGRRRPDGTHLFRFEPVEFPPGLKPDGEGITALTALFSRLTEAHIRLYPDQWAWFHRRWLRRPPA
ncbi:MAG: lysophospholipid acyltransferase family protein [Deltaproteobacteria bacterium]|nr:lysophospholipid acyltransferase family protein [Deltaproteobacteria bacterium]